MFAAALFVLALVTSFLMISALVALLVLLKLLLASLTAVTVSVLSPFPQALD